MLSAGELLDKVPARLIKVAEYQNHRSSLIEYDNGQSSVAEGQVRKEVDLESRGEGGSNVVQRFHVAVKDKGSPNMLEPKLEDERGKEGILTSNDEHFPRFNDEHFPSFIDELSTRSSNSKLSISSSNDGHFLSIPKTDDDGQDLRKRRPYIVYCRNHNSFARHT